MSDMKFVEFGETNKDVIIMLHGGGLSWWNYKVQAKKLSDKYHIILPIIDGHADNGNTFVGIEDYAGKLVKYIKDNYSGKIKALCGLSLGAQIAVEILCQANDICEYAIIESVSLIPSKFTTMLIGPTFSMSYGLIKKQWFAKLQFKSLHINDSFYEDYYRDTCLITKSNMISFLQANTKYRLNEKIKNTTATIKIIVGAKEQKNMIKSAQLLSQNIANATLEIKQNMYHGEFSLNTPIEYVEELEQLINM